MSAHSSSALAPGTCPTRVVSAHRQETRAGTEQSGYPHTMRLVLGLLKGREGAIGDIQRQVLSVRGPSRAEWRRRGGGRWSELSAALHRAACCRHDTSISTNPSQCLVLAVTHPWGDGCRTANREAGQRFRIFTKRPVLIPRARRSSPRRRILPPSRIRYREKRA